MFQVELVYKQPYFAQLMFKLYRSGLQEIIYFKLVIRLSVGNKVIVDDNFDR